MTEVCCSFAFQSNWYLRKAILSGIRVLLVPPLDYRLWCNVSLLMWFPEGELIRGTRRLVHAAGELEAN